jgi:A/G-specific adenine glycosylase
MKNFKETVWGYFKKHKRDLPWRNTTDPYKILVSEVMLQQTQVSRIVPKYDSFLRSFPDFYTLAHASLSDLLREWKGIGYNRRALYLKLLAETIVTKHNGMLPDDPAVLEKLPGIGAATARSIVVYAYNKPVAFIETNIRRVYIHHFFSDRSDVHDKEILPVVETTLDKKKPREWYWALMDYGTWLSKSVPNPNRKSKHYMRQSQFSGSSRQLRGRVLAYLLETNYASKAKLKQVLEDDRLDEILDQLTAEGFVKLTGKGYTIA